MFGKIPPLCSKLWNKTNGHGFAGCLLFSRHLTRLARAVLPQLELFLILHYDKGRISFRQARSFGYGPNIGC
jgi:hypothetical protein